MTHAHLTESDLEAVDYFSVLARVRQLLPVARTELDHRALRSVDLMEEAVRTCGITTKLEHFNPEDELQFERLIRINQGDIYVTGRSSQGRRLRAIRASSGQCVDVRREIDISSDTVIVGVLDSTILLIHHESVCAAVSCSSPSDPPEDPRDLARLLLRQAERRRELALETVPPQLQQRLLTALEKKHSIAAMKYLRSELKWSLQDAKKTIDAIQLWWPDDLASTKAHRLAASDLGWGNE